MKKLILFIIIFFAFVGFSKNVKSQTLTFCESVSDDGKPVNESDVFYINKDGGSLYFLVNLPSDVNCTFITYKFNTIDKYGNEEYSTTITQDNMQENWTWFYKKIIFYDAGTYMIYVKDCNSKLLTAQKITIKIN
jgi:hypothetical protein